MNGCLNLFDKAQDLVEVIRRVVFPRIMRCTRDGSEPAVGQKIGQSLRIGQGHKRVKLAV
jgi:hypothetical protein